MLNSMHVYILVTVKSKGKKKQPQTSSGLYVVCTKNVAVGQVSETKTSSGRSCTKYRTKEHCRRFVNNISYTPCAMCCTRIQHN